MEFSLGFAVYTFWHYERMPKNENKVKIASTEIECAGMTMYVEDWMTCCLVSPRMLTSSHWAPKNCLPDELLSCRGKYSGTAVPNLAHSLWPSRSCFLPCLGAILGAASWWCLAGVHQHLCRYVGAVGVLHSRSPWAAEFPLTLFSKLCNVEPPM